MLNRRTLRAKALQNLFAYEQCREANYNVATEMLEQAFEPDLNSMEYQDPVKLTEQKEEAIEIFKTYHKDNDHSLVKGKDEKVINAVLDSANYYKKQVKKDLGNIKKNMITENQDIYNRYIKALNLLIIFGEYAAEGVGGKKSYKGEQDNFLLNRYVVALKENKELESITLKNNVNWSGERDLIRGWFKDIIYTDANYREYINLELPSDEQDYEIVNYLVRKVIFKNDTFSNYWESLDINWDENRPIIRSMVIKTLKSIRESKESFELATLSYNWDEDKEYYIQLFDQTVDQEDFLVDLIAKNAKNWEFERIAYTDRLILMLAISEMMKFPSIPVKVTINEYIELSKNYSTPKSKQFVNGVLDVIAVDLQSQGLIKKSGRGLIDNK